MVTALRALTTGYGYSVLVRVVSVLLVLACVLLLSQETVILLFITLGLGHFALAFWYQKGAGRWKLPATVLLLLSFVLISFGIQATTTQFFFVLTGLGTVLHMSWDEVHLLGGKHSLLRTLEYTPFVLLFGGMIVDGNFFTDLFIPSALLSVVVLVVYCVLMKMRHQLPDKISYTNIGWGFLAFLTYCSYLFTSNILPVLWFLGFAVVHYFIWYGEYARKVAGNPERRKTYYFRVALVNGLMFAGLFLWGVGLLPIGGLIYQSIFYFVWSFLHVTTSTRLKELPLMVLLRS